METIIYKFEARHWEVENLRDGCTDEMAPGWYWKDDDKRWPGQDWVGPFAAKADAVADVEEMYIA